MAPFTALPSGAAPSGQQATKRKRGKRGGRRRSRSSSLARRINAQAVERQEAWTETGQPDLTDTLTRKLDRDFAEVRDNEAGNSGEPFAGRTMKGGSRMSFRDDMTQLGWKYDGQTGGNHVRFTHPEYGTYIGPLTTSDKRRQRNQALSTVAHLMGLTLADVKGRLGQSQRSQPAEERKRRRQRRRRSRARQSFGGSTSNALRGASAQLPAARLVEDTRDGAEKPVNEVLRNWNQAEAARKQRGDVFPWSEAA